MSPPAMLLPVCSAAPSCSPLCPVTASHVVARVARRVDVGAALRSYADSLVAQVPDRPPLADSSILSPYIAAPDDIARAFGAPASELPPLPSADPSPGLCCTGTDQPLAAVADLAATAVVNSAPTDAAERALSDAPFPSTFPSDASEVEDSVARLIDKVGKQVFQAEDALTEAYDKLRLSAYDALGAWRKTVRDAIGGLKASVDAGKQQAAGGVTDASGALHEKVAGAGTVAVDVLRKAIVAAEDSLGSAATFVVYSYGSAKESLPPNVRDLLSSSEEKASLVLRPIGNALQQVYVVVEGVEKNVGLDPSDPIVQLAVVLGGSVTIGTTYWLFTYSGYSGDLSPESAFDLLKNDDKADLREKDGVPDLRLGARSKYASVASPEIKDPVKSMLKDEREFDDALLAVVIRNLKLVKRPYLVKGGFQAWSKNLRVKELKPETALTSINEDVEEILEQIKPTPTLVFGSLLGLSALSYALLEWEMTLQYIAVLSVGLTIYLRFSTYEDSEDLEKDLKLLLSPVRVGADALSWAAKKIEPNKVGLPTSPSTTAVKDRVLQAAAKHESQPSDADESSVQTAEA
ncbi:Rhodanese/Cell cycle control phosphatase superfamily protein [Zea mays]|uniref:Rhodanese/Cell cycle control phosphatase superfamily protein n=1 Tax=Zea mays TaxID=4577 RepID=A0A1D6N4Y3_MAIZE|nr:Rhodanese/Cell cycle control phosphatase superfamily protein [Zea mays]